MVRAAAYSAMQVPAVAVGQIVDKATGSNIAPNITFIDKPEHADFGGVKWHLQQVGSSVGGLVPFIGALALTKNISSAIRAEELALTHSSASAAATASMFRTGEMAAAGFVQGSLLEPNANKDVMFTERLTQGITSGVTMGSMHFLSNRLSAFTGASLDGATTLNKSLTTAVAGGAAGAIGLKVDELISGNKRTSEESLQSIYQSTFTGAALGGLTGAHMRLHQPGDAPLALTEFVARDKNFQVGHSRFFDYTNRTSMLWKDVKSPLDGPVARLELTDLSQYSPMQKAELVGLLHRDADKYLRRPEVIESFNKKIEAAWTDDLARKTAEYDEALDRARVLEDSLVLRQGEGFESRQDGGDYAAIRRLLRKQEAKLDDLYDQRAESLERHRQRIEDAMNEFLTEHNLPRITLQVIPNMESDASYGYSRVSLNGFQLEAKSAEPILVNSLYHELTHLRQNVLLVRLIADELGLPQHPGPEQIERVIDEYYDHMSEKSDEAASRGDHSDLSDPVDPVQQELEIRLDEFVRKVLTLRSNGEPRLSEADTEQAERIRQGSRDHFKAISVEGLDKIEKQLDRTSDFIEFNTIDFTARVLNEIELNPTRFKETYGFATIPVELSQLAREHSERAEKIADSELLDPGNLCPTLDQYNYYDSLFAKMRPIFEQQHDWLLDDSRDLMNQKTWRYLGSKLERQAFPTGLLAELTYRAQS